MVPMVEEAITLFEQVDFPRRAKVGIWEIHERTDTNHTLVLMVSGTGIAASAAATQAMISEVSPDLLALVGCAGAISPKLLPGDVAVASKIALYSSFQTMPDGTVNLDFPAISYRTDYTLNKERTSYARNTRKRHRFIEADRALVEAALAAGRDSRGCMCRWPGEADWPVKFPEPKCTSAVIGTADQINSDPRVLARLAESYGMEVEDCESAAVAQVAAMNSVPWLVIRGISDNELINPAYGEFLRSGKGDLGWVEVESTRNAWTVFMTLIRSGYLDQALRP